MLCVFWDVVLCAVLVWCACVVLFAWSVVFFWRLVPWCVVCSLLLCGVVLRCAAGCVMCFSAALCAVPPCVLSRCAAVPLVHCCLVLCWRACAVPLWCAPLPLFFWEVSCSSACGCCLSAVLCGLWRFAVFFGAVLCWCCAVWCVVVLCCWFCRWRSPVGTGSPFLVGVARVLLCHAVLCGDSSCVVPLRVVVWCVVPCVVLVRSVVWSLGPLRCVGISCPATPPPAAALILRPVPVA